MLAMIVEFGISQVLGVSLRRVVRGSAWPAKVLRVPERHADVEGGGDGAVAQAVRAQPIGGGEAGSAGEAPHQAPGVGSAVRPPLRSRKIGPLVRWPM